MKTYSRFLVFLLILVLALSTHTRAFQEFSGSSMGDALAESQDKLSNSEGTSVPRDDPNDTKVIDVWLSGKSIHKLTDDGVVQAMGNGKVSTLARNVVSAFEGSYNGYDIYVHSDGSIALDIRKNEHPSEYELDEEWNDLALVATSCYNGSDFSIGLKNDGTWISAGEYRNGECDVEGWTDIVQLETGYGYTVGLKSDGTVIATGLNDKGQCNVSGWTDIVKISVCSKTTLGLKSDGTVVATGNDLYDQCFVGRWKNVIDIFVGSEASYGLTKDGKVLCTANGDDYKHVPKGVVSEKPQKIEAYDYGSDKTIIVVNEDNTIKAFGANATAYMNFVNGTKLVEKRAVPETPKGLTAKECEQLAIDYLKGMLKNPESLQIHSISTKENNDNFNITIECSAMNSFGGYTRETFVFGVDKRNGHVTYIM